MKSEIFNFKENNNIKFNFIDKEIVGEVTVYSYYFEWNKAASDADETIEFNWTVPQNGLPSGNCRFCKGPRRHL